MFCSSIHSSHFALRVEMGLLHASEHVTSSCPCSRLFSRTLQRVQTMRSLHPVVASTRTSCFWDPVVLFRNRPPQVDISRIHHRSVDPCLLSTSLLATSQTGPSFISSSQPCRNYSKSMSAPSSSNCVSPSVLRHSLPPPPIPLHIQCLLRFLRRLCPLQRFQVHYKFPQHALFLCFDSLPLVSLRPHSTSRLLLLSTMLDPLPFPKLPVLVPHRCYLNLTPLPAAAAARTRCC